MLNILLLGVPKILLNDEEIIIKRRMVRALLYYLAGQTTPVSRTQLMLQFWPDVNNERARRQLRETLSKLRSQLPYPDFITVENNLICLDRHKIFSDVLEFEKLYDQATRLSDNYSNNTPLPNSIYQQMVKAVNLWRSPKVLEGESIPDNPGFEDWFFEMSNRLSYARLSLLDRLADHFAAIGDIDAAVRQMRSVLAVDIYDQRANLKLLNWLKIQGHMKEARAHCNYIADVADKDSSFELSVELQKACFDINNRIKFTDSQLTKWPVPFSIIVPYVGNHELLRNIYKNYNQGGTTVIFGEAGAGKTRLVYEFYQTTKPTPRLLFSRSHFSESMLPYQALIEMARSSIYKEEWAALDPVWLGQLATLLPELHTINPKIGDDKKWSKQSQRLILEAFYQLFLIIAKSGNILLVLDDAQWCDEGTLSIFKFLMERQFFDQHGLFIMAVREEQGNFKVEKFLRKVNVQHHLHRYYLELLEEEDVSQLIMHVLGTEPTNKLLKKIMKDTGGNPLYILEMLRAMMEEYPTKLIAQNLDRLPTPQNIHSMVRERLWNIDSNVWQVLSTAAVIGNEFTPLLVEEATALDTEKVVSALEILEKGHLIRSEGEGGVTGHYNFIHNKIREIVVMDLSQARKRMIHQNIAAAYEKRPGRLDMLAGIIAYHFTEAYLIADAFKYWIHAGQYSYSLFSIEEANNAFSKAEKLLTHFPTYIENDSIYDLYVNWGEMARDTLDLDLMSRLYTTLLGIGEKKSDTRLVGCAMTGLGLTSMLSGCDKEAMEYAIRAYEYLQDTDDLYEIAKNHNLKGMLYTYQNKMSKAKDSYQHSLEFAKYVKDYPRLDKVLAETNHRLSLILVYCGFPLRAISLAEESLTTKTRIMYSPGVLRASYVLGIAEFYTGNYQIAYNRCEPAVHVAEKMQKWYSLGLLYQVLTRIDLIRGDVDQAFTHINEIIRIGEKHNHNDLLIDAELLKGEFYRLMRDYSMASKHYSCYVDRMNHPFQYLFHKARLGGVLYISEGLDEGLLLLEESISEARKGGMGTVYLLGETLKNMGDFEKGDLEGLEEKVNKIRRSTKNRSLETTSITSLWLQGELAFKKGNIEEAEKYAHELVKQTREMRHFWLSIRGNILLHKINKKNNDYDGRYNTGVQELLADLDNKSKRADKSKIFNDYKQKVLSSM